MHLYKNLLFLLALSLNLHSVKLTDLKYHLEVNEGCLDLSNLELTNLDGISNLNVKDGHSLIKITEVHNLHINLSKNNLDYISPEITSLKNLAILDLSYNNLTEFNHELLSHLPRLTDLILNYNKIKNLDFTSFKNSLIDTLSVNNNQIIKISDNISNLTKLARLYLNNNKIKSIPESIGKLRLISLFLSNNKIKEVPESLFNVSTLVRVYLNNNKIKFISKNINNLNILEELELRNNKISKIECLNLPKLVILLISSNLLKDIYFIEKLNKLAILDASNNKIQITPTNWPKSIIIIALANNLLKQEINNSNEIRPLLIDNNIIDNKNKKFKALKEINKFPEEIIRYIYTFIDSIIWFNSI